MRVGRLLPVAIVAVAGCGGGDGNGGSASTSTSPSISASPTTTDTPAPPITTPGTATSTVAPDPAPDPPDAQPDDEPTLLVPAPEGLALWQPDRVDWLVTARPVAASVPDLTGGVLFQYVDAAEPEWVWDDTSQRWVTVWPNGGPQPILRQRTPGGATEVAVPADGSRLWLLDVGMVAGEASVAFGRLVGGDERIAIGFAYCAEVDMCGDFSWRVELVVRPIEGGTERVVHRALWQPGITESTEFIARLGPDLAALTVHPWEGDDRLWSAVEFVDPDGASIDPGYRSSPWCVGCGLAADLAPSAPALAYVERYLDPTDGRLAARAEAVLVDTAGWVERWRVEVGDGRTIDTDGERVVVATASTCPDDTGPELVRGDEGVWVERLQRQLNRFIDAGLVVDGRVGPATEQAVAAWQQLRGMSPTGTADPSTWALLLPDRSCTSDLVFLEDGRATPIRLDLGWGLWDPAARSGAPARGPALWVGPAASVPPADAVDLDDMDELAILASGGLGPFAFGAAADAVQAWLGEQLGEPDAAIVETDAPGWPLESCVERRFSYWATAGLTVGFTDLHGYDPTGTVADCDDAPHLTGWYVRAGADGSPWFAADHGSTTTAPFERRLTTGAGIGLGSTAGDLRAAEPAVTFGAWDIDEYQPSVFQTPSGLRGRVAWDPVADVQAALNERGATLAVDGTFGPRTEAALVAFQTAHGIDEFRLGPRTLDAFGVAVPDDAPIDYLTAGRWDWDF